MRFNHLLATGIVALFFPLFAAATVFDMPPPGTDVVGQSFSVRAHAGDSLEAIAESYDIGYHEMLEANPGINAQYIREGQEIVIPASFVLPSFHKGIVINTAEVRLYYFTDDGKKVYTYPVGLGRREWRTPTADTYVVRKKHKPNWYPPSSIRDYVFEQTGKVLPDYIPAGPENPLGPYAIYLEKAGYLIHGTNQPWSIGKLISAGCIRMHNADVTELFPMVAIGTKVRIVHFPYKVGWKNGILYLEAHQPISNDDPLNKLNMTDVNAVVENAVKSRHANVDWYQVDQAVRAQRGIPYAIANFHSTYSANQ